MGGTSCAAPLWAAFIALVNEQAAAYNRPTVGFINPAIYALGFGASYTNGFHDIATGSNTWSESPNYFYAVPGYDLCSGWGTPMGSLINLLALDSLQISPADTWAPSGAVGGPFTPSLQNYTLTNGGNASFSWVADATVPWVDLSLTNGTLSPGGGTNVIVTLNNLASNLSLGTFTGSVFFTNLADGVVQTRIVTLSIIAPPTMLLQPASLSEIPGTTAQFSAIASGGWPLSCQWLLNGTNLIAGGRILVAQTNLIAAGGLSGSVTSTLTISNVTASDAGVYALVVSNASGIIASSNAILAVPSSGPVIVQAPTNQIAFVGDTVQFTVAVEGTTPFTFQWQRNQSDLVDGNGTSGSSTPTLTLSEVTSADIGAYSVIVSNALGSATSTGALLLVEVATPNGDVSADGPPIVATQPESQIAPQGGAVTFSVLSAGAAPLLYQWQFNGVNINNATNAALTLDNVTTSQMGSYAVSISNPLGSTASSNAELTVLTGIQELITFDDLPYRILPVPADYANLTWSNFYYLNGEVTRLSGYSAGVVSLPKVAYNNGGTPASISASSPFVLFSADLTAAVNDNLQVEAQGYVGSTLTYDHTYTLSATTPTLIPFNYAGVTSVRFVSSGGTPHRGYAGSGTAFVIDNVSAFVQPLPPPPPSPWPLNVIYTFNGSDGAWPVAGLIQASNGNFYGTTKYGGVNGDGTVFCLTTNGVFSTLFSLGSSNAYPESALLQGSDGNLYGTSQSGGTNDVGSVFRLTTDGILTTLASFDDAGTFANPTAALLQGADGNFYGTTSSGGPYGLGSLFRMTPGGVLSPLVFFDGTNGASPSAGLILGPNGDFYGTTPFGGTVDSGTVFRIDTNGNFTTLASFVNFGAYPYGSLLLGQDGNLYGTTEQGGTNEAGTVFCLSTNGTLSFLASLNQYVTGGFPTTALIQGADGSFYGTAPDGGTFGTFYSDGTYGSGSVFNLATNGVLTQVLAFQNTNGLTPQASLLQGADGNLYGTTTFGGAGFSGFYNSGDGVVFRLGAAPLTAPPALITQPVNLNVPLGGTASFSVHAGGAAPLNYSWQRNGIPIPGANQPAYSQTDVQSADSGAQFSCLVSNHYGSSLSSNATLTVNNVGSLYSFQGPDGAWPFSALLQGADGAFYATTEYGGAYGDGTVFRLTTNGVHSILASFNFYTTGANPISSLTQSSDGSFYGTTSYGGAHDEGTVFKMTTDGTLRDVVVFNGNNGAEPYAGVIQASDGNFYGSTYYGGTYNLGTLFELTTNGAFTTLLSYDDLNGAYPYGSLLQGADGNLYGTTCYGGAGGYGTVFRVTTNGALTTLVTFQNTNGAYPEGGLVQGPGGLLYGTTEEGGTYGYGTLFSMTTSGAMTTLFSFSGASGSYPASPLLFASDGNFYGTTAEGGLFGYGTAFSLSTNGLVTTVFSFEATTNGSFPSAALTQSSDGGLYGTTTSGGVGYNGVYWSGGGVVFRLPKTVQPQPPLIVTQPSSLTVEAGGTAAFSVTAIGTPPLSYSWRCNGTPLARGALATFVTNNVQLAGSGSTFTCLVSNAYGSVVSSNAILTVLPAPPPPPPPQTNLLGPLFIASLYSFDGFDGGHPTSPLVQGRDGTFYGTTGYGGTFQYGTVFKMTPNGLLSPVLSFDDSDGAHPYGALTPGTDGNLYGMTAQGGTEGLGTVFCLQTNGTLSSLLSFDNVNGANPYGALVQAADGNFYGTTSEGGAYGYGTAFSISTSGALALLLSFDGNTNGAHPYGPLVLGNNGIFYGTTQYGGAGNNGTVFTLTTNGLLTTLTSFNPAVTGAHPTAALIQGLDGNFYGTTSEGGTNGGGVVFSMTPSGVLTPLFSFAGTNGSDPFGGLTLATDGNLYGTTQSGGSNSTGTIFRFSTNGVLTSLFSLGGTNGFCPQAGLVQGADGFLYGTATFGGVGFSGANRSGDGTVFRVGANPSNTFPTILAQPVSQFVTTLGSASFSITASGTPPLSYSWRRNGSPISGANQSSYLFKAQSADSGSQFSCVVNNAYGTVASSNAALTVFDKSGPLFSFHGPDGGSPAGSLVQETDGNFYGATAYGGAYGAGTVFLLTTNGGLVTLASFDFTNGAQPAATLLLATDGNFYGTTQTGGAYQNGTAFKLTPFGVLTTLASFNGGNGAYPLAPLVQGTDGNFYGTTSEGGTNGDGTIFCLTPTGALSSLFSFNGLNGATPSAALLPAGNGHFYGTTRDGGVNGYGTIFSVTTNGVLTPLFSFDSTDGANPQAPLTPGPDGSFYGLTTLGGAYGDGTVFRLSPDGSVTSLFSFAETNGSSPSGSLLQGADGNYYGTTMEGGTYGDGTIFTLSTTGSVTTILSLSGPNGSFPTSSLILGSDGAFYGTAAYGGVGYDGLTWSGDGVVFRFNYTPPPQPPVITMQPASQTVSTGGSATFSVAAGGAQPLSYAWQWNGTNVAGAVLPSYTINNVQYSESGSVIACIVSNIYGYTNTSYAILNVLPPPSTLLNGGFELGSFADWTSSGNFVNCFVTSTPSLVHSGLYAARLGPVGAPGYISQTFATIPGDTYQISCWLISDGKTPDEFSVSWNGSTLVQQLNISDTSWTNLQILAVSSNTLSTLTFGFQDDPGYLGLDDVAVYDMNTGTGTGPGTGTTPPQLQAATLANGMITFNWSTQAGQTFQVQVTSSLNPPNWTPVGPSINATSTTVTVSEPINNSSQQFFRCVLLP